MPSGSIFMHTTLHSLFINGDDGKYYQAVPETKLGPGTKVVFEVLKIPGSPPGFHYAKNVQAAPLPGVALKPSAQPVVNKTTATATATTASPSSSPGTKSTLKKTAPALAVPGKKPRVLYDEQAADDFEAIAREVDKLNWGRQQGFGPSITVKTKLKWEGNGKQLYLKVLETYQDEKIPGTKLWYYVGTMGVNKLKGGFRISAHSKPKDQIAKAVTYVVLHVEN